MQVNKRSGEDLEQQDSKKYKTKESSVAEAALKYEGENDKQGKNNAEQDGNSAIDSELLSHESGSFADNTETTEQTAESANGQSKTQVAADEHAQLSEELSKYNASRHLLDSNQGSESQQQSRDGSQQPQQSPSATSSHHSPPQPSTQILHQNSEKPLAGSEEWHRIRKDNHKEVERRRRETINSGIKDLAALLPTQDANKSQILKRAAEYIKRLKENENNNIEKWTLEKLLTDQAVAELTASNEKLKAELERAYREVEHWKKACSVAKETK